MAQIGIGQNNLGFIQQPIIIGQQGPEGPQGSPSTIPGPQGIQGVQGPPGEGSQTILLYDAVSSPASTKLAWETLKTYTTSNALSIGEEVIYEYYTKNVLGLDGNIRLQISDGTTTINTISLPFAQAQEFTIELSLKRSSVGYIYTIKRIGSVSLFSLVGQVADNFSAAFTALDETIAPTVSFQVFINDISTVLASQFSVQFQLIKFFKLNVGTGSPIGVQTVTGLNTDNTDPLNPVVQISVDGTTITGAGTTLSPLIAAKQLTSQNTIIVSSVNTGNPSADAIANGVTLKAAIVSADALNVGTRSATNRVAVLLTGGTYDANGTGFTLPSFIDIVGISSSPVNTILTNSTGTHTIIAPLNVDYGLYNIDLRAGTTAAVGDNSEVGQFHRWDNVIISGNCTTGLINIVGDFKRIVGDNGVDFANVTGNISCDMDIKLGNVTNFMTTNSGNIIGTIKAKIGNVSQNAFYISANGSIVTTLDLDAQAITSNLLRIIGDGSIIGQIKVRCLNVGASMFRTTNGNLFGNYDLNAGNVLNSFSIDGNGTIGGKINYAANNITQAFVISGSGNIDAEINFTIVDGIGVFQTFNGDILGEYKLFANNIQTAFTTTTGAINANINCDINECTSLIFKTGQANISGNIKAKINIASNVFRITGNGSIDANTELLVNSNMSNAYTISADGNISGFHKVKTGSLSAFTFAISGTGDFDATVFDSDVDKVGHPIKGTFINTTTRTTAITVLDGSKIERCKILGSGLGNSIIGTTTTAQIIYTATKEPIAAGVTGLLSNNFDNAALL